MRLREETKMRDKVTVQLENKHILIILGLSIVFSGIVFGLGIFLGKRDQGGMATLQPSTPRVPQRVDGQAQNQVVVPEFTRLPGDVFSKFSPAEMVNSLTRFWVESYVDTLANDEVAHAQEAKVLQDKVRARVRPDLYAAPAQAEDGQETPIDIGRERLATPEADKASKSLPQGSSLPSQEARPKAAPKAAGADDLVAQEEGKADVEVADNPKGPKAKEGKSGAKAVAAKEVADSKAKVASEKAHADKVVTEKRGDDPIQVYSVQLLAYRDKGLALEYAKRLESSPLCAKHKPFVMPVDVPEKGQFYRVRIGRFTSKKEAERVRGKVSSQEGIDAKVVSM